MNMVIKQTNKMKKMDITDSVENLCAEVQNQQNMKKLAMISRGELVVSEEFSKFLVEEYEHQNKAFEKFSAFLLINVQIDSRSNNLHYLSVQPSQSSITSILSAILQEFFIQANEILSDKGTVGTDKSFYNKDHTRNGTAVYVKLRGWENVSCASTCQQGKQ